MVGQKQSVDSRLKDLTGSLIAGDIGALVQALAQQGQPISRLGWGSAPLKGNVVYAVVDLVMDVACNLAVDMAVEHNNVEWKAWVVQNTGLSGALVDWAFNGIETSDVPGA